MLNELRGAVAHAVDVTMKYYPDFRSFSDERLEAFLCEEVTAQRLNDYQVNELRSLEDAKAKILPGRGYGPQSGRGTKQIAAFRQLPYRKPDIHE